MTIAPLVVSLGDPAGIGPELIAAAWALRNKEQLAPFCVIGGAGVLAAAAKSRGLEIPIERVERADEVATAFDSGLPVLGSEDAEWLPGNPTSDGALLSKYSLERATVWAIARSASGLVTAPVSKAQLATVGHAQFPGQTEFLADASGINAEDAVMMLAGPRLRTVPLTVHVALSEVPSLITQDLIVHRATVVARALERDFGISNPRLAVAGLNPHAGESGKFGDEETRVIAPAIAALRDAGIDVSGPHPADALFTERARAHYDVALCMYHDQALIPLKALDFDAGVNVTLGLKLVRTSPDHGTAFDIAGKNTANPGAMLAAIRMASECAARRADG